MMQEFEAAVREQEARKRVDSKGHALCGCGGEGKVYPAETNIRNPWYSIECGECYTKTRAFTILELAWAAWDKAMGLKEADNG